LHKHKLAIAIVLGVDGKRPVNPIL
jgi:hypothetical protein